MKKMTSCLAGTALFFIVILIAVFVVAPRSTLAETDRWTGVDESVVEKYAGEHGREARPPFINTDQGDLLLFVFLLAGVVGGFVAGYYWRSLLDQRSTNIQGDKE